MYKVVLNGALVDSPVTLSHGDAIMFGNHNLYMVVMPNQPVNEEMRDYDTIMKTMMQDTLNAYSFGAGDAAALKEMEEMRKKVEEEKERIENELKEQQKRIVEEKKRLTQEMEKEKKRLLDEMKTKDKNSEEMNDLREQLKKQQEETEKLKEEQRKKAKEFEAEKKKALKEIEDKKREDNKRELEMAQKKDLEFKLIKLIPMLNEANTICQTLGRNSYGYEPYIHTDILPDGRKVSKLMVKAYPDIDKKEINNTMEFEEFEDKLFMIREKWENVQYSLENGEDADLELHMEADQNEAETFGMIIQNQDKLIGNAFIFCDSLSYLLDSKEEWATVLNFKGDTKGKLKYSLHPTAYDERGEKINLVHYENIGTLLNHTLQVELKIHQIEGLPEKYCNGVYCAYNWIDEAAERFETEKQSKDRNPKFNYTYTHDLFVSNHIADQLQYSILMIAVFGRLSNEKMQDMIQDMAIRPHTQALLKENFKENKDEPFYEGKGGKQDVLKIDEVSDDGTKTKDPDQKVKELEQKLKKLQKENEKLKKITKGGKKDSSCCSIF